jgi:effector-binding domain-containing protein
MAKIAKIGLFEQAELRTLAIRTTLDLDHLPQVAGQAYNKIIEYLNSIGELPADAPYICYYNQDLENLDVEMGFPIAKALPGNEVIGAHTIPAQRILVGLHLGAYRNTDPLYYEMIEWLNHNGYQVQGMAYHYYLNDLDRPEHELLTKIVLPVVSVKR